MNSEFNSSNMLAFIEVWGSIQLALSIIIDNIVFKMIKF